MAEGRISVDQKEFMCSVCLDLLKDPVTIQCGHSYCKICITDCWDQEDEKSVYSCPQCRQTFSPRPALGKNTILAELVEKLKKTKLPADCYAGAGDVECDVCTGRKHKAVKSCLVCQETYCQTHFDRHEEFPSRKPHKVIDATGRLQDMICRKHDKELEMFCITDQQCICVWCKESEHKNHNTVSTAAQRTEKQKQLKETQMKIRQRIQQRQKDLHQLREAVKSHKRSAHTAVEDSEKIFTEIIRSIERSRSEATQRIRDQEKTAVSRAEGRLERLEQEINDLRRRDAELEQLSHTQDHIQFLQSFQSLSAPPESTDKPDVPFGSLSSFDGVRESVRQLRDKLEDFCKEEIKKISDGVTFTNMNPKTRNDFLQYSHQLTLDLNTVNKHISLSERNRVITRNDTEQPYPDHPDRFDVYPQVLCRESVCGRCYWEIQWTGNGVFISVSYKSISRKGEGYECVFGNNDQSWSLFCSSSRYTFRHNKIHTPLPVKSFSGRIGVCVDHSAGTLSFYSVSDTMSLIHTVQTTFTQPLYPGFLVYSGSSVKLSSLLSTESLPVHEVFQAAAPSSGVEDFMDSVDVVILWIRRRRGHLRSTRPWGRRSERVSVRLEQGDMEGLSETDVPGGEPDQLSRKIVRGVGAATVGLVLVSPNSPLERSAHTAVETVRRSSLRSSAPLREGRSEATQRIRDQEKTAVSRAEGRLERLEQEINDLRRRDAELEQLSHTQDHIQFLQSFQSLSAPPESTDEPDVPFGSLSSFDGVRESVRQLRDKLEDFCKEEIKKISDGVTFTNMNPKTRNDFLQYSHQLTLDLNTVHNYISLSERNRVITHTYTEQPYPDHPDRFDYYLQVLCRESVCGRCYWEIEWTGDDVDISVSYKSISRKGWGHECLFGCNDQSWSLFCSSSSYTFRHNNIYTPLPVKSISRRIGVCVDHSAGTLSFYSVSDTMSLIHTVKTTFTQPLYPGFGVDSGSSVKLC
ncbi:E3 ubiquitin/ISG15 ligase TRIM25-like [Pimephales promelas]|uniref:E3 ubiquitin/ISG15 ligase TRIM25-like n=1 Tax=Pimephales promelas TaxID=90988 RepID=UPI001955B1E2|nr:E3 ubiquitin/ISG15 ligase TRIM25-like [Pimephales promelas]